MAAVSWLVGDWLSLPIALEGRGRKMANFYSMFGFLAVNSFVESEPGDFDMLSRLPIEMALTVLRLVLLIIRSITVKHNFCKHRSLQHLASRPSFI